MKYLKDLYFKLVVSTVYTIRLTGKYPDSWKTLAIFFITINLMLNVLSIWMLIEEFVFPGFTKFLAFEPFTSDYSNRLLYIVLYFFIPLLLVNYLLVFRKRRFLETLENKYASACSKSLFGIHFFGSYAIALICLGLTIFLHNE